MSSKESNSTQQKSSSRSETGHAKNVANFQTLIAVVKTMDKYRPNSQEFTIAGLEATYQTASTTTRVLSQENITLGKLIEERQKLFEPLPQLSTRVVNALADTKASSGFKKNAAAIARKIQGRRATPIKKPATDATIQSGEEATPKTISVSQQGFDSMVEHFRKFTELLGTEPTYNHADKELSLEGLQLLVQKMETVNKAVKTTEATVGEQLRHRNKLLYQEETGLLNIASNVKKIVRGAYGARSAEAKAASAIRFKTYK